MVEPTLRPALERAQPRTRRALLGAALGAAAAAAASALARPGAVLAAPTAIQTETETPASARTSLVRSSGTVLALSSDPMSAVTDINTSLYLRTSATESAGLYVEKVSSGGTGITVIANAEPVFAGIQVEALDESATALWAYGGFHGVQGIATSTNGAGVKGAGDGPNGTGVFGQGVIGVEGFATSASGVGTSGFANTGTGVRGHTNTGTAARFYATDTAAGTALKVEGKARFTRSGRATIRRGASSVYVSVPGGLAGSPLAFATLVTYRSGVHVAAVTPSASTGKIRIRLNKVASQTSSTSVSWLVLG